MTTPGKRATVRRRYRKGWPAERDRQPWTTQEAAYALARDGDQYLHTAAEVAIELQRSVAAVDNFRRRVGQTSDEVAKAEAVIEPALPQWGGMDGERLRLPEGF